MYALAAAFSVRAWRSHSEFLLAAPSHLATQSPTLRPTPPVSQSIKWWRCADGVFVQEIKASVTATLIDVDGATWCVRDLKKFLIDSVPQATRLRE